MVNDFENGMWESVLKAAVLKNSLDELENYTVEEINRTMLPEHYDLKMRKLAKHLYYRELAESALYYIRKIAVIIFVILGISFILLFQFEEVRAACHNIVMNIYEKYVQFTVSSDIDDKITRAELDYIPAGFELFEENLSEMRYYAIYYNTNEDMLFFQVVAANHTLQVDNEHYDMHEVNINNKVGYFFHSADAEFPNCLYWNTEKGYYFLEVPLPQQELIKIAENVK